MGEFGGESFGKFGEFAGKSFGESLLKNKKILVLATSSVALYKVCDLVSRLGKMGAFVRVVLSPKAERLISPLMFEALSHNEVLSEKNQRWIGQKKALDFLESGVDFSMGFGVESSADSSAESCVNSAIKTAQIPPNHISYAAWADVVLLAPATANTIAKLAHGVADNILLTTALAVKKTTPFLIAPAMNSAMFENPATQKNLEILRNFGYKIIAPKSGVLACGVQGVGAMESVSNIIFALKKALFCDGFWAGKHVVISGGGSKEGIDFVRHISNKSSGKMAANLALAFYILGAKVELVASKIPLELPREITIHNVKSGADFGAVLRKITTKDSCLFMAAAIADFAPKTPQDVKLKKSEIGKVWQLKLEQTQDILSGLKAGIKVGFKAETDKKTAAISAKKMLKEKGCDFVVLNVLDSKNSFGGERNNVQIFSKNAQWDLGVDFKLNLSLKIAEIIKNAKSN